MKGKPNPILPLACFLVSAGCVQAAAIYVTSTSGVVYRYEPVDARGVLLKGTNVEGQHNRESYPGSTSGSSHRLAASYPLSPASCTPYGQRPSISFLTRRGSSIMRKNAA